MNKEARISRRKAREGRELLFRKEQLSRPRGRDLTLYLLMVISMAYIADEVASVITTQFQSSIITEFFLSRSASYPAALSSYQSALLFCSFALVLVAFYKPLSDRFGRKPFLVINVFCMGVGILIIYLSHSLALFLVGSTMISFFTSHDVQVVYLLESAPKKRRATVYGVSKSIAVLGTLLIPLLRYTRIGEDGSLWRQAFLFPAIFAFFTSACALLLGQESPVYLRERIALLEESDEERKARLEKKNSRSGLIPSISFAFHHRQMRFLILSSLLFAIPSIATTTYQSVMSKSAAMSEGAITTALIFYTVFNALCVFLAGFISDKNGRKPAIVCFSLLALSADIAFFLSTYFYAPAWLIGVFAGLFVGAFWSASDQLTSVMIGESAPTNLRAGCLTIQAIVFAIGGLIGLVVATLAQSYISERYLGLLYFLIALPGMLCGIAVMLKGVGETKDIDLDSVTGEEWDKRKKA